ncbi:peptide deformylase [Candidatus Poribacteria bacterium]|nr:peptide deformylase [Candidatus Poribacteria bacterium]
MAILNVARMGNPVLRKPADPVPVKAIRALETQRLIDDMIDTLREYDGVGLAAPQVHTPLQIVLIEVPDGYGDVEPVPLMTIVNPEIIEASDEMETGWEGCLSIPDIRGVVPRHRSVRVRGRDRVGKEREWTLEGFAGRIAQHEIDHLHGVLFLDRMTDLQTLAFTREYSRFWSE